ncbi:MAG TPA: hypothetical protein VGG92_16365 [Caulobacteraceae bacterium]|jgi:hypothetical protein
MGSLAIAAVMLACTYGAALLGLFLHGRLHERHLDGDTKDVVKLVMGLVATMSALVLGLLVASANTSHDRQAGELASLSADIILLDQTLALYGPDAQALRDGLDQDIRRMHDAIWSPTGVHTENMNSATVKNLSRTHRVQLATLTPKNDMQKELKSHAFGLADSIGKSRLLMFESSGNQLPWPFLVVLTFWLSVLFLGFGLLSRFNPTVAAALFLGSLSFAGAIFLILELSEPYHGILQVSDAPLRSAIAQLGR